ncbi:MAG: DNA polymerase III subunit gamma/tau, partial [Halioglobus sp.]|nr:DNA polymerase III subunit gamma/tau [Halioglobus sp.]
LYNIASNCELASVSTDALNFVLDEANATLYNDGHADKLGAALTGYFGSPVAARVAVGTVTAETPAQRGERLREERQAQAVRAIEGDDQLQALMSRFDGTLDRSSIAPNDD